MSKEKITLTPAEWWQFAPWQGMDSAPLRVKILMMYNDNAIRLLYFDIATLDDDIHPVKWLPLPTVQS